MLLLILVYHFSFLQVVQSSQCDQYIKSLIISIQSGQFNDIPRPTILYSGLSPNCPGQFLQCLANTDYTYYLTYKPPDFSINTAAKTQDLLGYFIGLCVPSFCNEDDIQNFQFFTRSEVYGYSDTKMNVMAWVGIGFLLGYIVLVLSATIMKSLQNQKEAQKKINVPSKSERSMDLNPSLQTQSLNEPLSSHNQPLIDSRDISNTNNNTLLDSFDGYYNYNKIFQIIPNRNILFGPKCIAVLMIIVSLGYSFRQTIATNNKAAATLLSSPFGIFITNIQLSFATLFWIFGINAAYTLSRIQSLNDIFKSILNKLIRAWPVLVLYTLFAYGIARLFISQPLSQLWDVLYNKNCSSIFWRKWLLVNTMIPDATICLPWTWVFQVEILLYILSPLLVVLHKAKKWLGYLIICMIIVSSMVYSFIILEVEKIPFYPSLLYNNDHAYVYYFQMHPLTRASQYYFGLLFGIFINHALDKFDDSDRRPPEHTIYKFLKTKVIYQWIFQIVGLAFIFTSFFMMLTVKDSDSRTTFIRIFLIIIPFALLIGMSLLVMPSLFLGKGKLTQILNYVLGSNFWSPLYKLSDSMYLSAPIIIGLTTYSLQFGIYYSYQQLTFFFLGDMLLIFIFSLILCSCLQIPFHEIQRRIETFVFGQKMKQLVVFIDQ